MQMNLTICGDLMSELRNFPFGARLNVTVNGMPVSAAVFEKNDAACSLVIEVPLPEAKPVDVPEASDGEPADEPKRRGRPPKASE